MAGNRPTFVNGALAKIIVNGRTWAYCTDVSYSIQVNHAIPRLLGMYEGASVEPLSYAVSGSLSVVRYARNVIKSQENTSPRGLAQNDSGNSIGNAGTAWDNGLGAFLSAQGLGADGRANESFDPGRLDKATTFDIQIYQKTKKGLIGIANLRNVRFTRADFGMTKRSLGMQRFNFVALYVDEDAFVATPSGGGVQF